MTFEDPLHDWDKCTAILAAFLKQFMRFENFAVESPFGYES